jgi:hypothetical protein
MGRPMARDPEVVLQRKLPQKSKVTIAGRGPISAILRYFVKLPQATRAQYTIKFGTKELNHLQIERIAHKAGVGKGPADLLS